MIEKLITKLKTLGPVNDQLEKRIREAAYVKTFKAGETILQSGQVCRQIALVVNGLTRSYYINDGKEVTSRFMEEGFIVTSWVSFYTQKPSSEIIEAAEDTLLACLSYPDIQQMYIDFPESNFIGRCQVEYAFYLSEQRTQLLRGLTATQRYETFFSAHPSLFNKVSLRHIASYLGMSEETLSRVRSKYHKTH